MKKITPVEEFICLLQGELFERVAKTGCDMSWFIPAYLNSEFCEREMDAKYSRFHTSFVLELLDFILPELGDLRMQQDGFFFNADVALWLGYMYRYLVIMTGLPSKDVLERIPLIKMCHAYAGLHTIDDTLAFETLCKDFNLNYEEVTKE